MLRTRTAAVVTCLFIAGVSMPARAAKNYSNNSSGTWNTASHWTLNRVPNATDTAIIQNGHTMTISATPTNPTIARLQVDVGGKLHYTSSSAYSLSIANQFVCNGICSLPSTGAGNWVVGDSIAIGNGASMLVTGTVLQTTTANGHFVNNGTFRRRGTGATTILGAFVNNGTFSCSTSAPLNFNGSFFSNGSNRWFGDTATVTFGGAANESICGVYAPVFYRLVVNKTVGTEVKQKCAVTLGNVARACSVHQGVLNTNGQDLNANAGTSATVTGAAGGKLRVTGSTGIVNIRTLNQQGTLGDFVVAGSTVNIWSQHIINYTTNAVRCSILGGTITYHGINTGTSSALYFPSTTATSGPGGFFADGGTVVFDSSNIYSGRDARFVAKSPAVVKFQGAAGSSAGQQYVYFAYSASSANSQWSFGDLKLEKTGQYAYVTFTYYSTVNYSLSANVTASSVTIAAGNTLYLNNYFASASYGYVFGSVSNSGTFTSSGGSSYGFLTVNGDFTNNSGATATWARAYPRVVNGNLVNAGTMSLTGSTSLAVGGALTNSSSLTITNATSLSAGSMTQSGSALSLSVSGPITVTGNLNNTTSLTMTSTGTFLLGSVTNTGTTMTLSSGSSAMTVAGSLSNSTSMTISNANPLSVGSLTNSGPTMTLSVNNPVTVATTLGNTGTMTMSGNGALTVTGNLNNGGTMTVSGPSTFTVGSLTNSGTMNLTAAIRYVVNGDLNNNPGGKLLRASNASTRRLYVIGNLVNNDSIYAYGYSSGNVSDTILGSVTNNRKMVYNYQSLYVGGSFTNAAGALLYRANVYTGSWLAFNGNFSNALTATCSNSGDASLYFGAGFTNDQVSPLWGSVNTVTFQGTNAAVLGGASAPAFYAMTVNKPGGSLTLGCDLTVTSATGLAVNAGEFIVGQRTLTLGTITASGKAAVAGSGTVFSVVGTAFANGRVTAAAAAYPFACTLKTSTTIRAKYAAFERIGTGGVYVQSGATIDPANNFSYCIFDHGSTTGPMLRVENTQTMTMNEVIFNGTAGWNIQKTSTNTGRITVDGGSGTRWGEDHDNDSYSLIDWLAPHDVGCSHILSPPTAIDSGTVVTPACSVYNYGTNTEDYDVRMRIGSAYNEIFHVTGHAPGTRRYVQFPSWTALPRGSLTVKCSTELATDVSRGNDWQQRTTLVQVLDVGPTVITVPQPGVRRLNGQQFTPNATWRNFGTVSASFEAWMILSDPNADGRVYYQKVDVVNLAAGATRVVNTFPPYTPTTNGTWSVRCSTGVVELAPYRGNNEISGTFEVTYLDVAPLSVTVPRDTYPPGATIQPSATWKNNGIASADFQAWMILSDTTADGRKYWYKVDVAGLAAGAETTVSTFPTASLPVPGDWGVRCSTWYADDMVPGNNVIDRGFFVCVLDVAAQSISVPARNYGRGTVIAPEATWVNNGDVAASFEAWMILSDPADKDGRVYQEKVDVAGLAPHASVLVNTFPTAPLNTAGTWSVRCSTGYPNDQQRSNDIIDDDFDVGHDIGVEELVRPREYVQQGQPVLPRVRLRNYSDMPASFNLRFLIDDGTDVPVYDRAEPVTAEAGAVVEHEFTIAYEAGTPGVFTTRAEHDLAGDVRPENNRLDGGFEVVGVVPIDIGAIRIVNPPAYVETSTVFVPEAVWKNFGSEQANFRTWFMIFDPAGTKMYEREWNVIGLYPGEEISVRFPSFNVGTNEGNWRARCSTYAPRDPNPENDVWVRSFRVSSLPPWPYGWGEAEPMTHLPADKPVKDGGWLAYHVGGADGVQTFFAARGNKAPAFYEYYPVQDSWASRKDIPEIEAGKTKLPSKGCVGVSDGGNFVYMTKGNNTLGFWRYNVTADNWEPLPEVPLGPGNKRVKGGTDLAYVAGEGDTGWVYLLKGYKTEFYRYNTVTGAWDLSLPEVPAGGGKQKYDKGSFLVYDGAGSLYAHQAKYHDGGNHYMFRYDIGAGRWADTLKGMPLLGWHSGKPGKSKKSKDGAAGDWFADNIYALKGGNTQQFFCYFPAGDSWQELDTVPGNGSTLKKKYVKAGADFATFGGGVFFALKGNKTFELWRYRLWPVEPSGREPRAGSGAMAGNVEVRTSKFELLPNPIASGFATVRIQGFKDSWTQAANVRVFDAAGRCVFARSFDIGHSSFAIPLDIRRLSSGVYLVRLDADGFTASRKLVVQR